MTSHPLDERRPRQMLGHGSAILPEGRVQAPPDVHIDVVVLLEDAHPVRGMTRHLHVLHEGAVSGLAVDHHRGVAAKREVRHNYVELAASTDEAWPVGAAELVQRLSI